jgi:hypothetical protein
MLLSDYWLNPAGMSKMRFRFIICTLILTVILGSLACRKDQVVTGDIALTLDSLEHKLGWIDHKLAMENWLLLNTEAADSLEFYKALHDRVVSDRMALDNIHAGMKQLGNDSDRRRASILYSRLLLGQVETDPQITDLRNSLSNRIGRHQPEFEGRPQSREYLNSVYLYDRSRPRRELAYRAINALGSELSDDASQLFRLRNQTARKLGYNDYFRLVFSVSEFSHDEYLTLLENLDSATVGPYENLINSVRNRVFNNDVELWDLTTGYAPALSEIDRYFPADSQLKYIKRGLRGLGFDIDDMPIYLTSMVGNKILPFALSLSVQPPYDIRIVFSLTDGLAATRGLAGEFGTSLGGVLYSQPKGLFTHIDGAWSEGMSRLMSDILVEDNWLREYASVPDDLIDRLGEALRIRNLVEIRQTLTWLRFEYEAYRDPNRDLNKVYWQLHKEHMLLPKHEEIMPWTMNAAFVDFPVSSQNPLLGKLISAQTLAYLKRSNASVVGNLEIRSFLEQNYFRFGGRFEWGELLERGTGESLNPAYLLESLGL